MSLLMVAPILEQQATSGGGGGGISYVGGSIDYVANGVGTDLSPALPTHQADDFAVVMIYSDDAASGTSNLADFTTPSGWTEEADWDRTSARVLGGTLYSRRLTSSSETDPAFAVSNGNNRSRAAWVAVFRGVDTTTALDAAVVIGDGANDDTPSNGAITTVTDGAVVICGMALSHLDANAWTPPSGYALGPERIGSYSNLAMSWREVATAGAETPGPWDSGATAGRADHIYATVALRPA